MTYSCPSFSIEVPNEAVDTSTYSFVIPVQERFHPSVVIRREPLPMKKTFSEYTAEQVPRMKAELKNFRLLRGPEETAGRVVMSYEWGEGDAQFQQTQIYLDLGRSYYLLTLTQLAGSRVDHLPALQRIAGTFRPKA